MGSGQQLDCGSVAGPVEPPHILDACVPGTGHRKGRLAIQAPQHAPEEVVGSEPEGVPHFEAVANEGASLHLDVNFHGAESKDSSMVKHPLLILNISDLQVCPHLTQA